MFDRNGYLNMVAFKGWKRKWFGTEGHCLKVVNRGSNRSYAVRITKRFEENEGPPYQILRKTSFLSEIYRIYGRNYDSGAFIAKLLYIIYEPHRYILVHEYVEHTLRDALDKKVKINKKMALDVVKQRILYFFLVF